MDTGTGPQGSTHGEMPELPVETRREVHSANGSRPAVHPADPPRADRSGRGVAVNGLPGAGLHPGNHDIPGDLGNGDMAGPEHSALVIR